MTSRKPSGRASKAAQEKTARKKAQFLEQYREHGTITDAARAIKVNRCTPTRWMNKDEAFAEAVQSIDDELTDELIRSNFVRARDGWLEPVWHQGSQCGEVRKFDHTLAIFFMKHRRPKQYMERYVVEKLLRDDGGGNVESLAAQLEAAAMAMRASVQGPPEGDGDGE